MDGQGIQVRHRRTLSWRSRDPSWWNSAVVLGSNFSSSAKEFTANLAARMDQVPGALTALAGATWQEGIKEQRKDDGTPSFSGFTLPWHQAPKEQPKAVDETPPTSGAGDLRRSRIGQSMRMTKRMPVQCSSDEDDDSCVPSSRRAELSSVSQRLLLGDTWSSHATIHSLDDLQLSQHREVSYEDASCTARIEDGSVKDMYSARLNSPCFSSPEAACDIPSPALPLSLLDANCKSSPQIQLTSPAELVIHVTKVEPAIQRGDIFPGKTQSLSQIRIKESVSKSSEHQEQSAAKSTQLDSQGNSGTALIKRPGFGGSPSHMRPSPSDAEASPRNPSERESARKNSRGVPGESLGSRLLRRLRMRGWSSAVGTEVSKSATNSGKQGGPVSGAKQTDKAMAKKVLTSSTRKMVLCDPQSHNTLDPSTMEMPSMSSHRNIQSNDRNYGTPPVQTQEQVNPKETKLGKKPHRSWSFKRWKMRETTKVSERLGIDSSTQMVTTSMELDQETMIGSQITAHGTHYGSARFASHLTHEKESTARRASTHRRSTSWGSGNTSAAPFTPSQPRLPTRDAQELLVPPRRLLASKPSAVNDKGSDASSLLLLLLDHPVTVSSPNEQLQEVNQERNNESLTTLQYGAPASSSSGRSISSDGAQGFYSYCSTGKSSQYEDLQPSTLRLQIATPATHQSSSLDEPATNSTRVTETWKEGPALVDSNTTVNCQSSCREGSSSMEQLEGSFCLPPSLPQEHNSIRESSHTRSLPDITPLKSVFKCREIEDFNKFLRTQKKQLLNALHSEVGECFQIILSGTDSEVSSMVAALCTAWFLQSSVSSVRGTTWHAVPVINIPRQDMLQHKDAVWLFDSCGIDYRALLFSDEVALESLLKAGRLKITVIGQHLFATHNEVGSCCTLIAERLLVEAHSLLQVRYMKTLLLAGILLDTENLDFASSRDTEMTNVLLVGSGSLGRNGLFNQLRKVQDELNVSELSTAIYGEANLQSGQGGREEEAEHSDKESIFSVSRDSQGQDQTSPSSTSDGTRTSSCLDEDFPRFAHSTYTSPPASKESFESHKLGCPQDPGAVSQRRAAGKTGSEFVLAGAPDSSRSTSFSRLRKRLF